MNKEVPERWIDVMYKKAIKPDWNLTQNIFDGVIRDSSEGEDGLDHTYWDSMSGCVGCHTLCRFQFVISNKLAMENYRNNGSEEPIYGYMDAIASTYEAAVRDWLKNGPWL